jgi:hypothetical protein
MSIEAMKLALEALEAQITVTEWKEQDRANALSDRAIIALRIAIKDESSGISISNNPILIKGQSISGGYLKKEWVSLTWDDFPDSKLGNRDFLEGARWAGSLLKEKNQ